MHWTWAHPLIRQASPVHPPMLQYLSGMARWLLRPLCPGHATDRLGQFNSD